MAAYLGEANRNATEAARMAGYKHPGQQGHALLKKLEIQAAITNYLAEIKRKGIAVQQNRIDALVDRHKLLYQVIAERAEHEFFADVPGGKTGIVVKHLKTVRHIYERDPSDPESEEHQVAIEQWETGIDTALLKELREHEKQVAQELGEWTEKTEVSGADGGPIRIRSVVVPLPVAEPELPESESA